MSILVGFSLTAFLAAVLAGGLICWLFAKRQTISSYQSLALLLGATALTHFANGIGLQDNAQGLIWRRIALAAELVQPAALFYVGIQFLNPLERKKHALRCWSARIVGVVGLVLAVITMTGYVFVWLPDAERGGGISLTTWGHVPYMFIVGTMAFGVAQLELVLRASSELVRYRLKFIVIGLGGIAGYQIYQASQMLLLPFWRPEQVMVFGLVTIISLVLLGIGLARSRSEGPFINVYLSPQALFGSVTVIAIGLYLLVVGIIGAGLRRIQHPLGAELNVILVFFAVVALVVTAFSKSVRVEIRRFLARNFYRSKYDYRAEWLRVTEAFQQATTKEAILDQLLDLLIKTFSTTIIAIWMFRDADRQFYQVRPAADWKAPIEPTHPVLRELLEKDGPAMIRGDDDVVADLEDQFVQVGAELCFPIRSQGRLVAIIVLGKQLRGDAYGIDDCDLLHGICHHVGVLLSHAVLAEERQAAAELEALHRFSVFCLHDLKNLGARLSLVAQNAEQHGRDPAFQEAALRTVADTAKKMTNLMSKLSLRSFNSDPAVEVDAVDILPLIEEIVAPLKEDPMVSVKVMGGPLPPVAGVREQIHQVLLNVVLNARQAIRQQGKISIAVDQLNRSAIIKVEDTGCGIPHHMLGTLFGLSQSSRPGGLGIGLYQCRKIVEAHGGTIEIRSEVGTGTRVRIELPLHTSGSGNATRVIAPSVTAFLPKSVEQNL